MTLDTRVFDPFFFFGPAQTAISRVLLLTATQGNYSVNAGGTIVTWSPFAGASYAVDFVGAGLTINADGLVAGTVNGIETYYTATSLPIITVTGLDTLAATLEDVIDDALAEQVLQNETDQWTSEFLREAVFDAADQLVVASNSGEILIGGDGDDTIRARGGDDTILASDGDDAYFGGAGNNWLSFLQVDFLGPVDVSLGTRSVDYVSGPTQTATGIQNVRLGNVGGSVSGDNQANVLDGGDGNDVLSGRGGNDTIRGGGGNDTLTGNGGDDLINGDDGHDDIRGNAGDDELFGFNGADEIWGGLDNDFIDGGTGFDTLVGYLGNDTILGGSGDDFIYGGGGNDIIEGNNGLDRINGNDGTDVIEGGAGNDEIKGGAGNDTLRGDVGNDFLEGETGNDRLRGGAGDDLIEGGAGDDDLRGNGGNDEFLFDASIVEGHDIIRDFSGEDFIRITAETVADVALFGQTNTRITYGTDQIFAIGVDSGDLTVTADGADVLIMFA